MLAVLEDLELRAAVSSERSFGFRVHRAVLAVELFMLVIRIPRALHVGLMRHCKAEKKTLGR